MKIKSSLIMIVMLIMLTVHVIAMTSTNIEGTRVMRITGDDFKVTVPEKVPDFVRFPGRIVGNNKFNNGNEIYMVEHMNAEFTIHVLVLAVKSGNKLHIIAMQITYCKVGFDKIGTPGIKDPAVSTEFLEDVEFMKYGKFTDTLKRVDRLTDHNNISRLLDATGV